LAASAPLLPSSRCRCSPRTPLFAHGACRSVLFRSALLLPTPPFPSHATRTAVPQHPRGPAAFLFGHCSCCFPFHPRVSHPSALLSDLKHSQLPPILRLLPHLQNSHPLSTSRLYTTRCAHARPPNPPHPYPRSVWRRRAQRAFPVPFSAPAFPPRARLLPWYHDPVYAPFLRPSLRTRAHATRTRHSRAPHAPHRVFAVVRFPASTFHHPHHLPYNLSHPAPRAPAVRSPPMTLTTLPTSLSIVLCAPSFVRAWRPRPRHKPMAAFT
jgi:hypothetical protein